MRIAIISDSHIPDRQAELPAAFREKIERADHVVHAGDYTSPDVLGDVRDLATELTAVHGNMDGNPIDLPSVDTVTVDDVTLVVTHGTVRSLDAWYDAVADAAKEHATEPRVGIGGHTHQVEDEHHDGVRVLNPGSVTGADPATDPTMMTATVDDGALDVRVHELS